MALYFKITSLLFVIAIILSQSVVGQREAIELTFTGLDSTSHRHLDSIKLLNRSRYGNTMLYWPDTVLSIYYVGTEEQYRDKETLHLYQNYPNPFSEQTKISIYIPEHGKIILVVSDIVGRIILQYEKILNKGIHSFSFTPGPANLYFFTTIFRGGHNNIKLIHTGSSANKLASLNYLGGNDISPPFKFGKNIQGLNFQFGDKLLFVGFSDNLESGILDIPEGSTTYTFQFATNIPCLETPTVEFEGQVYNTIQIFSQCWLKENLNVGSMIQGILDMTSNDTIEKYCYYNEPDSCTKYGGLYQWDEMMQYTLELGTQGICPPGWHIPTDEEWKVLEGAVDSWYGIGNHEWDLYRFIGYDVGLRLKTIMGWQGFGRDSFGFSSKPGGFRLGDEPPYSFEGATQYGVYWSSTKAASTPYAYSRYQVFYSDRTFRYHFPNAAGHSVRCIKDD
jgi:uncharacterized protein (TIGR02145 family)